MGLSVEVHDHTLAHMHLSSSEFLGIHLLKSGAVKKVFNSRVSVTPCIHERVYVYDIVGFI